MDYPRTEDDWWKYLQGSLDDIRNLVIEFHPKGGQPRRPMKITAEEAENVSEWIRAQIALEGEPEDPLVSFDTAVQKKDGNVIVRLLNETWFGIPESMAAHDLSGFGVLCNLCSESECVIPYSEEDNGEEHEVL